LSTVEDTLLLDWIPTVVVITVACAIIGVDSNRVCNGAAINYTLS